MAVHRLPTVSLPVCPSRSVLGGVNMLAADHFGVCRALLDANLLPRVITGTSAGALSERSDSTLVYSLLTSSTFLCPVAAFICTHTDEEVCVVLMSVQHSGTVDVSCDSS